jgi:predicted secreted protein
MTNEMSRTLDELTIIAQVVSRARQTKVNSRDFDDANTALSEIAHQYKLQEVEIASLQERLDSVAEQKENEFLRMRADGPEAAKDELISKLLDRVDQISNEQQPS